MSVEAYEAAVNLLHRATTPSGIVASRHDILNYRRVFCRDAMICGLAGLLWEDEIIVQGLKTSLETLAEHQGAQGQIPSNVQRDTAGKGDRVSYGGLAGRVDTIPWFVIGACHYADMLGDSSFTQRIESSVKRGLDLLEVWEYNSGGLVYVPQSGEWADEYILHGYTLYVQLLRLWALRGAASLLGDSVLLKQAERIEQLIRTNYWPSLENKDSPLVYHPRAYEVYLDEHGQPDFWLPCVRPSGYITQFDAWSNALAILLQVGDSEQGTHVLKYGQGVAENLPLGMVPAFWPPVREDDPQWGEIRSNFRFEFRNRPYEYHNGGTWPVVCGWWGMAQVAAGRVEQAKQLFSQMSRFSQMSPGRKMGWTFHEYANSKTGEPMGTSHCSWSAAGVLLLKAALEGKRLLYGRSGKRAGTEA